MFKIGEFSKIGQISVRRLRHYDEIGLLTPVHIDPESGYRYYSAEQLPRINRIIALRELGFSLDQIKELVRDDLSADEIRGMLKVRMADIEKQMQEEAMRIQIIQSRLKQIESEGAESQDIVMKSVPARTMLGVRDVMDDETMWAVYEELIGDVPRRIGKRKSLGYFVGLIHSEAIGLDQTDVEMGYFVENSGFDPVPLAAGRQMNVRELPASGEHGQLRDRGNDPRWTCGIWCDWDVD